MKQWMANCRGCGKLIVWTKMQSGRPMPCDPEIIRFTKGGTQAYVTPDGFVIHGTPKQDRADGIYQPFRHLPESKRIQERVIP